MIERHLRMTHDIMLDFAKRTGLSPAESPPVRYLWTDAFALCNFLGLYRQAGDEQCRNLALLLIDQVHATLGRHRPDDSRKGWISGLDDEEGRRHPTAGGLRIGKELNERRPDEPFDEHSEWDRDGQYYHYVTQWMHALDCASRVTGDATYHRWAVELAKTTHARFAYTVPRGGERRLYWKMSIDLSRPLVSSMGHHDPLDGLITYSELQATSQRYSGRSSSLDLSAEIADMAGTCEGKDWATDDPLGIGGLLVGAYRMARLIAAGNFIQPDLLGTVLDDCLAGLEVFARGNSLRLPADYRLAFRELGLAIGLQAAERLLRSGDDHADISRRTPRKGSRLERLERYTPLSGPINTFWLDPKNREAPSWKEHRSINMVMLATSLAPDGYLSLG